MFNLKVPIKERFYIYGFVAGKIGIIFTTHKVYLHFI